MRYAVYDIGSNSVKFLIAERGPEGRGLRVLAEKSQATRLAEDLIATAELKPEAVERTLAVLRNLKAKADALGVGASRAVATSAVRDAGNRKQFLKAAAEILGAPLLVLSGDEEAEGVYRGIASDPAFRGDLTGIDVGGGSVEWIVGRGGRIGERMSLPVGCVRLRERFIPGYPLPPEALARFLADLQAQLEPALRPYHKEGQDRPVVGTGGTITAAAALDLGLSEFDGARIHGHELTLARLERMISELAVLDLAALEKIPGLPAKRADIVVPGLAVFIASLRLLGADRITASIRGLRYGILDALMEEQSA
jgi:exopolyphosphatase/guanosine-5'-triphosphate,3'-diphosphate pyrophosphatase